MELIIVLVVAAAVSTIVGLHRDGLHKLTERDDWRGLRSEHLG